MPLEWNTFTAVEAIETIEGFSAARTLAGTFESNIVMPSGSTDEVCQIAERFPEWSLVGCAVVPLFRP